MRQTEGGVIEQMRRNARPVQLLQLIDRDDRDWLIARKACCVAQQSIRFRRTRFQNRHGQVFALPGVHERGLRSQSPWIEFINRHYGLCCNVLHMAVYSLATSFRLYTRAVTTDRRQFWVCVGHSPGRYLYGKRRPSLCANGDVAGVANCSSPSVAMPSIAAGNAVRRLTGCALPTMQK
jgi:hypothetical protein